MKAKTFKILCLSVLCGIASNVSVYAEETGRVAVMPMPELCDNCVTNALLSNHNNFMNLMFDYFYKFESEVSNAIKPTYKDLLQISASVDQKISASVANLVSYYLKDTSIKIEDQTKVAKGEKTATKYDEYVFTDGKKASDDVSAFMNIDSLLLPKQYTEQQKEQAKGVIKVLETLTPLPDVIEVTKDFYVNVEGKSDPERIKFNTTKDYDAFVKKIENNKKYLDYKKSYRSAILARSVLFGNILRLYQERLPLADDKRGKSIAQLDYDSATWRLDPTYRELIQGNKTKKIEPATPVTIEREMLYLLTELRYDLYQLRQQNERILLLQSMLGLQMSSMSELDKDTKMKQIGKILYCTLVGEEKDSICKDNSQNMSSTTELMQQT